MKKLVFIALTMFVISSCAKTYYQIFSIKPENSVYTSNGSPVYVQDGLEFTYNFWGEYGNVRFVVYNSNDFDVVVDMTKSSFIRNSIAEDYYQGKEYETRVATGVYKSSKEGVAVSVNKQVMGKPLVNYLGGTYDVALSVGASVGANSEVGTTVKKQWETAMTYKEPESVRIPAKSAKAFYTFNINEMRVSSVRLWASDYYNPIKFTKDSTPLQFRNRICVKSSNGEDKYYDMNFYISEIGNLKSLYGDMIKPTSFYIPYSSYLENSDTNEEIFKTQDSQNATYSSEPPKTSTTSSKKSTGYNRDTAVARLNEINTSLSKGDTTQIELFKMDIQGITNWYSGVAEIYIDIDRGLREAKKLIRQYSK